MDINYNLLIKISITIVFTVLISQKIIIYCYILLHNAGCLVKNYRGAETVCGMGIIFVPVLLSSTAFSLLLNRDRLSIYIPYLFAVCAIGFAGLLDDIIGNKHIKGINEHLNSVKKGRPTTGLIKAFIGLITSAVVSLSISKSILEIILNIFIIALFTNTLNLFDLRPGRCIKAFMAIGFIIIVSGINELLTLLPLLIILTVSLIYFRYDLKEACMLGDTGSNILGITLGYFSSVVFDTYGKLVLFLVLFSINAAAERISLTKIISGNKILNYLDNLGRSS